LPTPRKGYRLKDGTKVPGYSAIVGEFKNPRGLMWWSNRLALDPLLKVRHLLEQACPPPEYKSVLLTDEGAAAWRQSVGEFLAINPESWDHNLEAARAADAGTAAHQMVDDFIRGREFDPEPYADGIVDLAKPAFEGFRRWAEQSKLSVGETEIQLVSERYRFGGTRDATTVNGQRAIVDWKTGKAVYGDMLLQLAAYGILDEEQGNTIDGGYHLLRISKPAEPGDPVRFAHHHWDQLDVAKRGFLLMRELYDVMKRVEGMV
jgi:hypothetical protein